jgi:hypothetical protein
LRSVAHARIVRSFTHGEKFRKADLLIPVLVIGLEDPRQFLVVRVARWRWVAVACTYARGNIGITTPRARAGRRAFTKFSSQLRYFALQL